MGYIKKGYPMGHERYGSKNVIFENNKKIILATQSVCAICGLPVDKSLKSPHPMSPSVDHIIPISKGGDATAIDNLQLAHRTCNRMKSDKLIRPIDPKNENKHLPQSRNWRTG